MTTVDEDARGRAANYRQTQQPAENTASEQPAKKTPRSLDQWASAASEAIEEAMKQGSFDNLPGKGKPLNLNKDPFTPADSALAFDILKNNDLTPGWMQQRNDLLRDVEQWRTMLRASAADANAACLAASQPADREQVVADWQVQCREFQAQVDQFNRRIGTINLQLPSVSMELFKLRLNEELKKAGAILGDLSAR